jgi:diguanylate cyclase (GGDEF)-like protein
VGDLNRALELEVDVSRGGDESWLGHSLVATIRTERQAILIRWIGSLCAAVVAPLLFHGLELFGVWGVCLFAILYSLVYTRIIIPRYPRLLLNGYLTTTGDAALATAVIAFSGGLHSDFFVAYYLVAVVSAIRFGGGKALYSIAVETACYAGVVFATTHEAVLSTLATILFRMSFGAMTAVLVGFVIDRARAAEKELEEAAVQAKQQLSDATAALTGSLDVEQVMQEAARWTAELSGATQVEIQVVPPSNLQEWLPREDPKNVRRLTHGAGPAVPGGAVVEIPLVYGSESLGHLRLHLDAGRTELDAVRRSLVETFASRCGPALANVWTYAAMQAQALADPTTGLANHRRFKEFLADCEQHAERLRRPLSILMLDLDMFKEFNDTYGHLAGDRALRQVGHVLKTCIDDQGVAARYGGDEFVAVLPGVDATSANAIAHAVDDAFKRAVEQRVDGLAPPMGLSIGWATATAGDADYQTLVGRADLAMYFAKRSGGGVKAFEEMDAGGPLSSLVGSIMTQLSKVDLRAADAGRGRRAARSTRRGGPARTLEVVRMLLITVKAKDPKLFIHCRNVARLCFKIARRLGLSAWEIHDVGLAGLLHDVGKICVPDAILQKPGALTPEEMAVVRQHADQGADMLAPVPSLSAVALAVRHHHENFGGGGYPDGIAGEKIPLPSRIVLVADAYDAITSDRPYRKGRTPAEAVQILRENQGRQFDPRVVATLTTLLAELNTARSRRATHAEVSGA